MWPEISKNVPLEWPQMGYLVGQVELTDGQIVDLRLYYAGMGSYEMKYVRNDELVDVWEDEIVRTVTPLTFARYTK